MIKKLLFCASLLLACLPLAACAGGSHAEYAPADHPWIGKCAAFTEPMAYITNLSTDLDREEVVRIGRVLERSTFAEYLRKIPKGKDLIVTPVPPGTTFEITAVFMIVYDGYSRMFVDDVEMAVLRDNHGQVSTTNLSSLEPCS